MLPFTKRASGPSSARSSSSATAAVSASSDLWYLRYAPVDVADCAMHKTKQSLIKTWLVEAFSGAQAVSGTYCQPILALVGVSGCAKSTAVELLCRELGISVTPWSEDLWGGASSFNQGWQRGGGGGYGYAAKGEDSGVEEQFANFAVSQGVCRLLASDASSSNRRRIVLVHDPPEMGKDSEAFAVALAAFAIPVVLIVSTSTEGRDDAHFSLDSLLPTSIRSRSNFQSIYCQPIATTLLVKALDRVLQLSKVNVQRVLGFSKERTKEELMDIATMSLGDLRNAIINLEFRCASKTLTAPQGWSSSGKSSQSSGKSSQSSGSRKRKLSTAVDDGEEEGAGAGESETAQGRELLFSPLHAIAKLLSAKLDLCGRTKYRSLDEIIEKCDFSGESALLFLQFNCAQHVEEEYRMVRMGLEDGELLCRAAAGQLKEPMAQLDDLLSAYGDVDLFVGNKYDSHAHLDRAEGSCYPDAYVVSMSARAAASSKGAGLAEQVEQARAQRFAKSAGLLSVRKPQVFGCMRARKMRLGNFARFRDLLSDTYYGNSAHGKNKNGNKSKDNGNYNNNDDDVDTCTDVLLMGLDQVITVYAPFLKLIASSAGRGLPGSVAARLTLLHSDIGASSAPVWGGAVAGGEETADILRTDDIAEFV